MKQAVEPRQCRQCSAVFTPAHPNGWVCGDACRRARANAGSSRWGKANLARRRETSQVWRDANRDRYRAQKRRMKAANPEHYRARRREWYHAHKGEEREAYRRWQAENRARRTAYMHEWERRKAAIRDGKARLAGAEDGFLLIRARSGFWRAAEAGQRIGQTETIMALFFCVDGAWAVSPPVFAPDAVRKAAQRMAQAEERRACPPARRGRKFSAARLARGEANREASYERV